MLLEFPEHLLAQRIGDLGIDAGVLETLSTDVLKAQRLRLKLDFGHSGIDPL
jgi:hypothetical protein